MERTNHDFKVFLGNDKDNQERVYLTGFKWDCGWYWGGGYLEYRTRNNRGWRMHTHFDSVFLNGKSPNNGHSITIWDDLKDLLDNATFSAEEWWRIKDLYKQFYTLKEAAATFQHGGHCTSENRNPEEIKLGVAETINTHIETVIIPELENTLKV